MSKCIKNTQTICRSLLNKLNYMFMPMLVKEESIAAHEIVR